ncbi:GDP-mannose 4,6-dehydratase [Wenzhouxiangella limi]
MRVLLTGSRGFTGVHMARELTSAGWEVVGTGPEGEASAAGDFVPADLTVAEQAHDLVQAVQPDAVVHLAAISFVGHGEVDAFYRVNLLATRHLLAALADAPKAPQCLVLASSANIYGNQTEGKLDEQTTPNPANDYAVSKLAMEYMARLWFDRLPIVITRPFNYTGPGQAGHFLLPKIVDHFRRRTDEIELGNLDVWRDFSDVRAVAKGYRGLLEKRPAGQTFNICSGRLFSLREVLAMAEKITGHRMKVRVNPAFVRSNEVEKLCGDPGKLRRLLVDWDNPPLEETLRWMLLSN